MGMLDWRKAAMPTSLTICFHNLPFGSIGEPSESGAGRFHLIDWTVIETCLDEEVKVRDFCGYA